MPSTPPTPATPPAPPASARNCLICLILLSLVSMVGGAGGCVERTLTVKTEPPGAVVSLNGVEVGRSPVQRDFTWYGVYDVALRKEGYEFKRTRGKVIAPWWQWPPIDFFAEFFPFSDHQTLHFTMQP